VIETSDVQSELASLRKLAKANTHTQQRFALRVGGFPHQVLADVVNPISMKSKAPWFILTNQQQLDIFSYVF